MTQLGQGHEKGLQGLERCRVSKQESTLQPPRGALSRVPT